METGQLYTRHGLFTFITIYPLQDIWSSESSTGISHLSRLNRGTVDDKSYRWKLITFVPTAVLEQKVRSILPILVIGYVGLMGFFGLSLWFLINLWNKRLQALADLKQSEGQLRLL